MLLCTVRLRASILYAFTSRSLAYWSCWGTDYSTGWVSCHKWMRTLRCSLHYKRFIFWLFLQVLCCQCFLACCHSFLLDLKSMLFAKVFFTNVIFCWFTKVLYHQCFVLYGTNCCTEGPTLVVAHLLAILPTFEAVNLFLHSSCQSRGDSRNISEWFPKQLKC